MMANVNDDIQARRRSHWDQQSVRYDQAMTWFDRYFFGDSRQWVCGRAVGRTLEIGIGTGLNLPFYPSTVELVGIDLSPKMLDLARSRAADLSQDAELVEGDAQRLPFDDGEFDTVVATFTLCAVPSVEDTLVEADRVLRPGGALLLADHVRPTNPPFRWSLKFVQWVSNRLAPDGGERFLRRPFTSVEAQGYAIEAHERFKGGFVERIAARKPAISST